MAWFGPKCVRASRKAEREYLKKIFPFLLVVYETLLVCQVSDKLIFDPKINGPLLGRLPLKSNFKFVARKFVRCFIAVQNFKKFGRV